MDWKGLAGLDAMQASETGTLINLDSWAEKAVPTVHNSTTLDYFMLDFRDTIRKLEGYPISKSAMQKHLPLS